MVLGRIQLKKILDRRVSLRLACAHPVRFDGLEGAGRGEVRDFSEGGLFVRSETPPALGAALWITLPGVSPNRVALSARVVRVEKDGFALRWSEPRKAWDAWRRDYTRSEPESCAPCRRQATSAEMPSTSPQPRTNASPIRV